MKIAMVAYEFPSGLDQPVVSGEVKNPFYLARGLADGGHDVSVYSVPFLSAPRIACPQTRSNAELPTMDIPDGRGRGVVRYAGRVRQVRRALARYLPSDIDVVHAQAPALAAGAIRALAQRGHHRPPVVVTGHGTNLPEATADGHAGWRQSLRRINAHADLRIDRYAFSRASHVISVSQYQTDELEGLYRTPTERIGVIHNGIDLAHYHPRSSDNAIDPGRQIRLLFVGRLVPKKGVDVLLHAFRDLLADRPSSTLTIVGGSPEFDTVGEGLRRLAQELRVQGSVTWLNSVPESRLPDIYRQADIAVFPSSGYESLPTVILEAMACGIPVIATDAWGAREALGSDHPGLLAQVDRTHLHRRILDMADLVARDDTLALKQLTRVDRFALSYTVRAHEDCYRAAMGGDSL